MKKLMILIALMVAPVLAQAQGTQQSNSSDKTWNVQFSPLAFLIGAINADIDYAVNDNWTVGPQFVIMNIKIGDLKATGSSFGGHARYYFDGVYRDGWFGTGSLSSFSFKIEDEADGDNAEASAMAYGLGGGYHWFWDSFNLSLGLNLGGSTSGKVEVKDAGGTVTEEVDAPTFSTGLSFNLGFTF